MPKIVALCGGVGGAKLAEGLQQVLKPGELTLIINTGDDFEHRGLPIWPDIDTVLYTLAGKANAEQGWGRAEESWSVQAEWRRLGADTWFQLGDRDIALHLLRREWQGLGWTPARICARLAALFGVPTRLLPMSESPAPTTVVTPEAELAFQEYFVHQRCAPRVTGFRYGAAEQAAGGQAAGGPAAGTPALEALDAADLDGIILCPSNPYLSIAPILAVPGLRQRLARTHAPIIAVSPIVGGQALKGPAAKIMQEMGMTASPQAVAQEYADFLDLMLVDAGDLAALPPAGGRTVFAAAPIVMRNAGDRRTLAQHCLAALSTAAGRRSRA
jgi:LPPG:FO 2-phospho-L-lactate transferase